ncbi:MAG: sialate O-acetylesterase [Victivallales bacterium]
MKIKSTIGQLRKAVMKNAPCAVLGLFAAASPLTAADLLIEHPSPFTVIQRDTDTTGIITVSGKIPVGQKAGKVKARFNGGEWQEVKILADGTAFSGGITGQTGQGALEVRTLGGAESHGRVETVGVGDLFLITGQSNADGRGTVMVEMNLDNPFIGVKYHQGKWSKGDDPSSNDPVSASPWPIVLNDLIPDHRIPVGFITAALGSTVARQWRHVDGATSKNAWGEGGMFARTVEIVKAATGGTMKIKAVIYHQGENDMTHWNALNVKGDYTAYKEHLVAVVTDLWDAFRAPVLVGQITNLNTPESKRRENDNIRRAQQEVWTEHPHALQGAVTYDIMPTDGVHYKMADNMRVYAGRWTSAIQHGVYGEKKMAYPSLQSVRKTGDRQLTLTYDQPLRIAAWDGKENAKSVGFSFVNGGELLTDVQVVSTAIAGNEARIELDRPVASEWMISYGSGADGQGEAILRSKINDLPVPMMFERKIDSAR